MVDIVAIISKPIFEEQAKSGGKLLGPGSVLPLDRYLSKNKALAPLAQGGRLVLVTVRPPNERLWLVAILENPVFKGDEWRAAAPNQVKITDISGLRKSLKLASGKGLAQNKGALGMSLQTPRALAPEDMEAISGLTAAGSSDVLLELPAHLSAQVKGLAAELANRRDDEGLRERLARKLVAEGAAAEARRVLAGWKHLNAHEVDALPCLCKLHIDAAPPEVTVQGLCLGRDFVLKQGRILHFWAPKEVLAGGSEVHGSMRASLGLRLFALEKERKQRARLRTVARALARQKAGRRSRA